MVTEGVSTKQGEEEQAVITAITANLQNNIEGANGQYPLHAGLGYL